jgi:hypothetical protein
MRGKPAQEAAEPPAGINLVDAAYQACDIDKFKPVRLYSAKLLKGRDFPSCFLK